MTSSNRRLPNTDTWLPREPDNALRVSTALAARCDALEETIKLKAQEERDFSFDSFNSGSAVEDIVREAMRGLLPSRYEVTAGTIVDASGSTAGDADIVIFNSHWFPQVHTPATVNGRRKLLPFEGVYAVGEVKQTLTAKTLDDAMEKLVTCHRLARLPTPNGRLTENREFRDCTPGLSNPLYSFVLGTASDGEIQPLVERFFDINKSLRRLEIVRALCVLGKGTVTWAVRGPSESKAALFMNEDLHLPVIPSFFPAPECGPALFTLIENLMLHLYHSVLGPEDIAAQYGPIDRGVKVPADPSIALAPDPSAFSPHTRSKRKNR